MSELHDIERRVAVLEQIAHSTDHTLQQIAIELRGLRNETQQLGTGLRSEVQALRTQQHEDFRWLLRFMIAGFLGVLGLLAHGLHWF